MCVASGRWHGRARCLGPFYPQRLSPPRAIGGGLERVSAIAITTVISRCRFALKRCTSCPQPASVACLASGFLLHAARYARYIVSFSGCRAVSELADMRLVIGRLLRCRSCRRKRTSRQHFRRHLLL